MATNGTFTLGANALLTNVYVSGQVRGSDDTSNAPSYAWSNNLSTGFYRQSSNVIGVAIAGTNALIIGSNIGIDTLTPQYDLDVNGIIRVTSNIYCGSSYSWPQNSNTGMYLVGSNVIGLSTGGSNRMVIGSNVGIGTTMPAAPLHVTGATTVLNQVSANGLINYYPFDGNVNDTVGVNNLTGTPGGYVNGKVGQAVNFTHAAGGAATQMLSLTKTFTPPLSLSLWINSTSFSSSPVVCNFATSGSSATLQFGFQLQAGSSTIILYLYHPSGLPQVSQTITQPFALNTWYHLVGTLDASLNIQFYVNGIYIGTTQMTGVSWNATQFGVGANMANTNSAFNGFIDDLRIYNRVLSATEINLIYQNQVGDPNVNVDSRLGVGIAIPQYSLDVVGNASFTGNVSAGNIGILRNRIINGNMLVFQRNASVVIGAGSASTYCIDMFKTITSITTGGLTISRQTLTSSDYPYVLGHLYSCKILVSTACSSYSYILPGQMIEGVNINDLSWGSGNGAFITISLWLRTNLAANSVISFAVRNKNASYTYVCQATIMVSGTWQYVTQTIPPPPVGSVWAVDNTGGLELFIGSYESATMGTPGLWYASNKTTSTGAANIYATLNNYIEFTGVQLEKGTIPTQFEFRSYQTELALCQRYYVAYNTDGSFAALGSGYFLTTTSVRIYHSLPVPMRSIPTVYNNSTNNFADHYYLTNAYETRSLAVGNVPTVYYNSNSTNIGLNFDISGTTGSQCALAVVFKSSVAGSAITFSAEM